MLHTLQYQRARVVHRRKRIGVSVDRVREILAHRVADRGREPQACGNAEALRAYWKRVRFHLHHSRQLRQHALRLESLKAATASSLRTPSLSEAATRANLPVCIKIKQDLFNMFKNDKESYEESDGTQSGHMDNDAAMRRRILLKMDCRYARPIFSGGSVFRVSWRKRQTRVLLTVE